MSIGRGTVVVSRSLNASDFTYCRDEKPLTLNVKVDPYSAFKITTRLVKRFLVTTSLGTRPSPSFTSNFLIFTFGGHVAFLRGTLSPKQATLYIRKRLSGDYSVSPSPPPPQLVTLYSILLPAAASPPPS